ALAACTTGLNPVLTGQPIIVTVPYDADPAVLVTVPNQLATSAATAGAVPGAVAGVAASAACGPFIVVCLPGFVAAGGAAGAGIGASLGYAADHSTDSRKLLNDKVQAYVGSNSPHNELWAAVAEKAKAKWTLVTGSPL